MKKTKNNYLNDLASEAVIDKASQLHEIVIKLRKTEPFSKLITFYQAGNEITDDVLDEVLNQTDLSRDEIDQFKQLKDDLEIDFQEITKMDEDWVNQSHKSYHKNKDLYFYYNQIKNFPLLTSAEEIELAKRIEKGDLEAKKRLKVLNRMMISQILAIMKYKGCMQ